MAKQHRDVIRPHFELAEGWALPILTALNQAGIKVKPSWPDTLGKLALSIETRLNVMATVKARLDKSREHLIEELDEEAEIQKYVNHFGFQFRRRKHLFRLQGDVHSYAIEARACFFNLAGFYRGFLADYLSQSIGKKKSYEKLAKRGAPPGNWSKTLETVRNGVAHGDTPWLQFELVTMNPRAYEVLIDFDGTPRKIARTDPNVITLAQLYEIESGLERAREGLRKKLISDLSRKQANDRGKT